MKLTGKALLSVSDKRNVAQTARRLNSLGFELLSTGGTARALRDAGLDVTGVSEHTGFPEILGGRVKTLHPKIHGGILARGAADAATLHEHAISPITVVIVNLYPFEDTVAREGCTLGEAVEQIDIGGPAMLRAAAKNHEHVIVLVEPEDYGPVLDELESTGTLSHASRLRLAARAFDHVARYDRAIATWLGANAGAGGSAAPAEKAPPAAAAGAAEELPAALAVALERVEALRYGENPHQRAALYHEGGGGGAAAPAALRQHAGKALSFNNIIDTDTALAAVMEMPACACVIVKHANPCGAALGTSPIDAYTRAHAADATSAFGGIVAFNEAIDATTVEQILARQFVEVIVAPAVADDVPRVLASKPNVRLLTLSGGAAASADATARPGAAAAGSDGAAAPDGAVSPFGATAARAGAPGGALGAGLGAWDVRATASGVLLQERDHLRVTREHLRVVTRAAPTDAEIDQLLFAWTVVKWVKSNAIVYTRAGQTIGIGGGQTSRVDAARLGATKARQLGFELAGAVMASDAFFPFRDGIDEAAAHGVRLVIQPGGSKRDDEVIAAADAHGMAMVFTGHRHFRH